MHIKGGDSWDESLENAIKVNSAIGGSTNSVLHMLAIAYEAELDLTLEDFGNISNPKYVFRGLDKFVNPPRIIDGDNYEQFSQQSLFGKVTINIFNISKLNSESKDSKGKPARIKRLNEVLGESYFEYLKNLPDLCIFMDESHHYHADKSFEVINELQPILGIEVTATPQVQKGTKAIPFKNVVYEYSLAHALKDEKYIKVPAVVTRKDFKPEQYSQEDLDKEKLIDGIKLHIDTQSALDIYARTYGKPLVKPFVLVVAKDTEHSKHIKEYLTSYDFYRGYYKDKVLEINANHEVFTSLKDAYENDKEKLGLFTNLLYNQALLIEGLPIQDPVEFTNDICKVMIS